MLGIPVRYLLRHPIAATEVITHPVETWVRVLDYYLASQESKRPVFQYDWDTDLDLKLHQCLGLRWPCSYADEFPDVYQQVMRDLEMTGIRPGPESFGAWNDGDEALGRAIWCLIRHAKPARVVETGVAHGVTSRIILEAMQFNQTGHLWSVDLPPLERNLREQIGVAVRGRISHRWSYVKGPSRLRLPRLLSSLGTIDLFIHDSMHSERNVRFEVDLAWPALRVGGALVVDDVDANSGFRSFTTVHAGQPYLIGQAEPVRPDSRRFNNKGLFGVVVKQPLPLESAA